MRSTNRNPATGIAYGYIAAAALDGDLVAELMDGTGVERFHNHTHAAIEAEAKRNWMAMCEASAEGAEKPFDSMEAEAAFEMDWDGVGDVSEESVEGIKDGVHYASSWLGGALNFFVFESPHVTAKANMASPCVPGAAILDTLDGDVEGYDVPPDWRREEV